MPILLWGVLVLVAIRVAAWQMLPRDLRAVPFALWVIDLRLRRR
jgi:hypothetical protein